MIRDAVWILLRLLAQVCFCFIRETLNNFEQKISRFKFRNCVFEVELLNDIAHVG